MSALTGLNVTLMFRTLLSEVEKQRAKLNQVPLSPRVARGSVTEMAPTQTPPPNRRRSRCVRFRGSYIVDFVNFVLC